MASIAADYYVPRGYARAVFDVVGCRNSGGCYDYGGYRERITGKQLVEYLGGEPDATGAYVDDDGVAGARNVGMVGGSDDGTTAIAAAVEDPDHLAAIIPQVAIDRWDDYAFGGGVRYFLNNEYPTDEGFDTPLAFDLGFVPGLNVDDGSVFTGGQTERMVLTGEADDPVEIRDVVPAEWSVGEAYGDVAHVESREDGSSYAYFDLEAETVEVIYFVEAPSDVEESGRHAFGPVEASAEDGGWVTVPDTGDENYVVGLEQP